MKEVNSKLFSTLTFRQHSYFAFTVIKSSVETQKHPALLFGDSMLYGIIPSLLRQLILLFWNCTNSVVSSMNVLTGAYLHQSLGPRLGNQ